MVESEYIPFLSKVMTPRRLEHSLGVMQVMGELAAVYGLDIEKACTIDILHDAGKDLPLLMQEQILEEANIQIQNEAEMNYVNYLHAPVSAYFVYRELGITDEIILGAISTHAFYGDNPYFDHAYSWCLRFSDMLEPTRDWRKEKIILNGANKLEELVYSGKMLEGAWLETDILIRWFTKKGIQVHPNMIEIRNKMAVELGKNILR